MEANAYPQLCAGGCGFYGCAGNENLCSKCYKEFLDRKKINSESAAKLSATNPDLLHGGIDHLHLGPSDHVDAVTTGSPSADDKTMKVKNRCKSCDKKVGLSTGFKCQCGNVFCGRHRYPEVHTCNVDRKAIGRKLLEKMNPVCVRDKLDSRV